MQDSAKQSFLAAYDELADSLYKFIFFRVFSEARAEELLQETFLKTWTELAERTKIGNLRAFLYRVARNLVIDEARKKKIQSLEGYQEAHPEFEPASDGHKDMEQSVLVHEVIDSLEELAEDERELTILRYVNDLEPRAALASEFEASATRAASHFQTLSADGRSDTAAALAGEFESRLNAQASLFGRTSAEPGAGENTGVSNHIRGALEVVVPLRIKFEGETSGSTSAADRRSAAEGKMKAAANVIVEAEGFIVKKKAALGAAATADAEAKLAPCHCQ